MSSIWRVIKHDVWGLVNDYFCIIWLMINSLFITTFIFSCVIGVFIFRDNGMLTADFTVAFQEDILKVVFGEEKDERLWKGFVSNVPSKYIRLYAWNSFSLVKWGTWIWHCIVPVRRSILLSCLVLSRLPIMYLWCKLGFVGPNICVVCSLDGETIDHVFLFCSVIHPMWKWLFEIFGIRSVEFDSANELVVYRMRRKYGIQLSLLSRLVVVSIFWDIWYHRNAVVLEEWKSFHMRIISTLMLIML